MESNNFAILPMHAHLVHQWQQPIKQAIETLMLDLFHRLDAKTLSFSICLQGLSQMRAYYELLTIINRDVRQRDMAKRD